MFGKRIVTSIMVQFMIKRINIILVIAKKNQFQCHSHHHDLDSQIIQNAYGVVGFSFSFNPFKEHDYSFIILPHNTHEITMAVNPKLLLQLDIDMV